jgi:hypothetical protein
MKGLIRSVIGLFLVFGSIGTLDIDPSSSMIFQGLIALVGVALLGSGVLAMKSEFENE